MSRATFFVKVGRCALFLAAFLIAAGTASNGARAQSALDQAIYDNLQGTDNGGSGSQGAGQGQKTVVGPSVGQPLPVQSLPDAAMTAPLRTGVAHDAGIAWRIGIA